MVSKDIGLLRSKDSEGEKNSSLKQQLNSLLYLRKVIDHRIHRLQGEDTDSFGVPSQVGKLKDSFASHKQCCSSTAGFQCCMLTAV